MARHPIHTATLSVCLFAYARLVSAEDENVNLPLSRDCVETYCRYDFRCLDQDINYNEKLVRIQQHLSKYGEPSKLYYEKNDKRILLMVRTDPYLRIVGCNPVNMAAKPNLHIGETFRAQILADGPNSSLASVLSTRRLPNPSASATAIEAPTNIALVSTKGPARETGSQTPLGYSPGSVGQEPSMYTAPHMVKIPQGSMCSMSTPPYQAPFVSAEPVDW